MSPPESDQVTPLKCPEPPSTLCLGQSVSCVSLPASRCASFPFLVTWGIDVPPAGPWGVGSHLHPSCSEPDPLGSQQPASPPSLQVLCFLPQNKGLSPAHVTSLNPMTIAARPQDLSSTPKCQAASPVAR